MTARTFADILRIEVATLQAAYPERLGEIARASALITNGHVIPVGDGQARVLSCTDPTVWYEVNGTCSCPEAHDRKVHCKHMSAWKLYQHIAQRVAAQTTPAPAALTAPVAPPALPEAPCSVNVHVMIAGRDVQVTLRGTDEAEVLTRLEAVLARYPLPEKPQAAAPPQGQGEGWCGRHGVQMRFNAGKEGRKGWHSHRLEDGTWCKGK